MPAEVEIKDDATREDVNDMVKEYMQERAELTGDASDEDKAGQDAGASEAEGTSKQTPSGDETSVADDDSAAEPTDAGGEDSETDEQKPEPEDWLTDEVRAELPRWLTDEELSEFANRDELDRALSLMDRAAMNAGRDAGSKSGDKPSGEETSHRGKEDAKGEQTPGERKPYEIDLDLSEFDDDLSERLNGTLTGMRDHYESRLQELDERFAVVEAESQANAAKAVEVQFDAIVDRLGHSDLFGKSGEETPKQLQARQKLFEEHEIYMDGLAVHGRAAQMDQTSVERVSRMVFADHISKQEKRNHTRRLQRQSNMRTDVGAERPGEQEFQGPLKRHPDVQRAFKDYQQSLGDS